MFLCFLLRDVGIRILGKGQQTREGRGAARERCTTSSHIVLLLVRLAREDQRASAATVAQTT